MGSRKWLLIILILVYPGFVQGEYPVDSRKTSGLLYSPKKVSFPVQTSLLYSAPCYRFQIWNGLLAIRDINTEKSIFLDTSTGKPTTKPDAFAQKTQRKLLFTKKGNMEILGEPAKLIIGERCGYAIDENRYVTTQSIAVDREDTQYIVKYFDHGAQRASFTVCQSVSSAEVVGENLILYSNGTAFSYNLESKDFVSFNFMPEGNFLARNNRIKGNYMFFGRTVFNLEKYESLGDFGENPVFFKDYVLSKKFSYFEKKSDKHFSVVQVQTFDKKIISQKALEYFDIKFEGTIGSYAYGTCSDSENGIFIMKVPTWSVVYGVPFKEYARLIGDDGTNILLWKGEDIIAIKPENGSEVWRFRLGVAPFNFIESMQVVNEKVFVFERHPIDENKYCRVLKKIENGNVEQILQWTSTSPRRYNNDQFTEVTVFEDGLIKVPNYQTEVPIQIFDAKGIKVREITIPELMKEKNCAYRYLEGNIFVNCNGLTLYKIELLSGRYEKLEISKPKENNRYFESVYLLVDSKYLVAQCSSDETCIVDWKTMGIVRKVKGIRPWVLNGNLLAGQNVYVIDKDKIINLPQDSSLGPVWGGKQMVQTKTNFGQLAKHLVIDQDGTVSTMDFNTQQFLLYERGYVFAVDYVSIYSVFDLQEKDFKQDCLNSPATSLFMPYRQGYVASNSYSVYEMAPCPTYSIKRISDDEFEIRNTRTDGQAGSIQGSLSVVPWGFTSGFKGFEVLSNRVSFGPICPGQSQIIKIDTKPVTGDSDYVGRMGVIVESNGCLDRKNTDSHDKSIYLYDGYCGISPSNIISISVWDQLR